MSEYWTPAHHAVEHEDAETLARLLADGADPNEAFNNMTLLADGADPNEAFNNMTLLTHAIDVEGDGSLQSGQPLTVHTTAILLAFGADPELAGPGGRTPMEVAEHYCHDLAAKLLRAHISEPGAGNR